MALLIALALFVAQLINFSMLLRERRNFRFEQATGPAVARIVDAVERSAEAQLSPDRGRVRLFERSPIDKAAEHRPEVEQGIRDALRDAGLRVGRIETAVVDDRPARLRRPGPPRGRRPDGLGSGDLIIAVERIGGGWLVSATPWPRGEGQLFLRLIAQTLILYGIILLPVLWIGRRISRPLQSLAVAARNFTPGEVDVPIVEDGPQDLRDVVAAFNALRLRVTAMLDEKDRMLGAIGHDLRTPLAALRVRIESVEDEADRTKMADTIMEMDRTLDDILSLARLGRPSEPLTQVDLAALVDAVVEDFRDLGADVTFDEETPRLQMRLRPSLMRRAVRNLIENAVKYGTSAAVSVQPAPGRVDIVVADQGPGIPEDRLADVFDPFTRLETSRNRDTGGIGLGLALASAIVADAGGSIRLENRSGGGLDATISLPR
ncbi:sensor histidine kinase [Sphingomonas sp. PB4P5]|uniref:sensor histidine kinase n=1 Tax=Parasphingomonas puruogangriensis TaxID=3096155 RepID=UPI002FCA9680